MNGGSGGDDVRDGHVNDVSGTLHGPLVQAREIHGGIQVHHGFEPLPPPFQLPAAGILVGRDEALAALDAVRTDEQGAGVPKVALVSGPAGIGKTAVALHWAHRERPSFPDGQLYADLRGHAADEPVEPAEVLGRFIRAFGIAPERIPAGLAERAALYQSLVSARRVVVVLDDVLSAAQVAPLLPASALGMAVVTSRWRLAGLLMRGARGVRLDRLTTEGALDLLCRTLGDDRAEREPRAARELVELCSGFPLALCVAAARLATRPSWELTEMVDALRHERRRLHALAVEEEITIQATLTLSYRGLPPDAARVYRLLALFPGPAFDDQGAAATAGLPRARVRHLLGVLVDANLLDDVPGGYHRYHDLTLLHARDMAEQTESPAVRDETVRRALDWFLHATLAASAAVLPYRRLPEPETDHPPAEPIAFSGREQALDWLEHEFAGVRAAARTAFEVGAFQTAWRLVDAIWPLFLYRGHHAERLAVDRLGLEAARACSDTRAEAKMLNRTGLALRDLGRPAEAAEDFRAALELWRRLGDVQRVASTLRRLGLVERDLGRTDVAIELFGEALERYRAQGESRKVALTLCDLGELLITKGCEDEALAPLTEARELLATRADDPHNQARALILLGRAHTADGATATRLLTQGLTLMRDIGSATGELLALRALGDLAAAEGLTDEARHYHDQARRLAERSGITSTPLR
ncbi:NTPase [Sphaerisporangium melleum]|uniref:NTPase n=1 Tax=Sphaerisporangium melleum TaxID=321316 RepID=A0A917VCN3_9ACTN|nr:tetratricopeptide repeat protein [Sphaerisporangium melleum]GGK62993.1 NTPase [Sphaerisporangium melleum]GII68036.1 NTPase [Sphaerisporangium melleum]